MIDIDTSNRRKLLLIFGIGFFSFAMYFRFARMYSNILHGKISIEKPRFPPITGFYHFAAVNNPWKNIVHEQMSLAHRSGLINASSIVYVTGLGNINENKTIYDTFANSKFIYEYDIHPELWEFPTLKKVEKFCFHNNKSLVWYAHSKGASHATDVTTVWRHLLNHFVLDKWQLCYELLNSTNYTTCGAALTYDSMRQRGWNTYYGGNMWWAKCSHINRLTRIEKIDQKDRYNAELYVTSEPAVGHFNCFFANLGAQWALNEKNTSCVVNQPMWAIR
jgi:hypothetical protein